ncbi:hypothetical protein [Mesorhizobium sp. B1-1-5]|uniref:hypothetical protein n=1 Tax=Mesorhizobium sp. B1-1-5 TaxID=2589979 RepID=UPI00112A96C7|nr:hypothetical protein [Mesorhizobium sp. B1-1-5]TPO10481.1 hypothetical protein FJ980_08085 [Mesorhizobium sp. B1-1-5]
MNLQWTLDGGQRWLRPFGFFWRVLLPLTKTRSCQDGHLHRRRRLEQILRAADRYQFRRDLQALGLAILVGGAGTSMK